MRRTLLSLASLTACLVAPLSAQDVQEVFQQGVDAFARGDKEAALVHFQKVLAMQPDRQDAYDLFRSADHDVLVRMLAEGGQMELVGKRLLVLGNLGRKEKSRDEAAIREKLPAITSDDVVERMRAVHELAAEHGEYAVPYLVYALGDQADENKRSLTMVGLTRMGDDVVPPLIAALESQDPYMRRNVALTLGYIGDSRANAALAMHAFGDEDGPVRTAASQALERCGGTSDVAAQYLALGDAYYTESDTVLMPHQVSDVVWSWEGDGLMATDCPRFLYAPELAKRNYRRALEADPASAEAAAGIARSVVTQRGRLDEWVALGQDDGGWGARLDADALAVELAGAGALELALGWALDQGDQIASAGLCRALSKAASTPTPNLQRALTASSSGAVRGEAAVALSRITGGMPDAETVAALTEAAARQVMQIAVLIDGDATRRQAFEAALESRGMLVNSWSSGGRGLAAIRQVPGVDVVLVASQLPDLTMNQVITDLKLDPRTSSIPVLVIAEEEGEYADVAGVVGNAAQSDVVEAVLSENLNRDREQANALSARAAMALEAAAAKGTDVSSAAAPLAQNLASRPDEVTGPALAVLGKVGTQAEVANVVAILSDTERSEGIRVSAANALAGIFGRTNSADAASLEAVRGIATSDDSMEVRIAAARALGSLDLAPEIRAELIRAVSAR